MIRIKREIEKLKVVLNELDKEIVVVLISIPVITTLSWYFASRTYFKKNLYSYFLEEGYNVDLIEVVYWLLADSLIFLMIPVFLLLLLGKNISFYGLKISNFKKGFLLSVCFSLLFIPVIWIISSQNDFILYYPTVNEAKDNYMLLVIYLSGLLLYVFAWEFLWRGYLQFSLEKKFGVYAVFIQVIPFVVMHNGKPLFETLSAIAGGIFLGYLAFRTRSFFWGFLLHFFLMFYIEIFSVLRYQNNEYGIGFNAIINILL